MKKMRTSNRSGRQAANGKLVIAPCPPRDCHLADLVARIRPDNLHKEVVTEVPQGNESW